MPRLEPLTPDWLAAALAIEQACQPTPWTGDQLRSALEDERACPRGVWAEDRLVGYAVLYRLPFEAELQTIAVIAEARRCGVARALLGSLIGEANRWGSERLLLEVRASNRAALGLYETLGFQRDGRRRGYYRNCDGQREDALLMSMALDAGRAS